MNDQGVTNRDHLERIEKMRGEVLIPEYEIPPAGQHLWEWFHVLTHRRGSGFGLSLIPYSEIKSWIEVRKVLIHDWEIEILVHMDYEFLRIKQSLTAKN